MPWMESDAGQLRHVPGRSRSAYEQRGWNVAADPTRPEHLCDCGFVAKTAAGLGAHRRYCDEV